MSNGKRFHPAYLYTTENFRRSLDEIGRRIAATPILWKNPNRPNRYVEFVRQSVLRKLAEAKK